MANDNDNDKTLDYTISAQCRICGDVHNVDVNFDDYCAFRDGARIQDAFPYIKPEIRELFISGTCPKCWKKMFSFDEEE